MLLFSDIRQCELFYRISFAEKMCICVYILCLVNDIFLIQVLYIWLYLCFLYIYSYDKLHGSITFLLHKGFSDIEIIHYIFQIHLYLSPKFILVELY